MSIDQTSSPAGIGAALATALIGAVAAGDDLVDSAISVSASTPEMAIPMRTIDRQPLVIDSLDFEFDIETRCTPGGAPKSVMLSVADTRRRLTGDELEANQNPRVVLRIPARQIAPLNIEGFCSEESQNATAASSLTVSDILSAQASLVCVHATGESISYASTGLDLSLACTAAQESE